MSAEDLNQLILDTIDKICSHRNRPSIDRLYQHLNRKCFVVQMDTLENILERLMNEDKIIRVCYNGNVSYRNAITWKKPSSRWMDGMKHLMQLSNRSVSFSQSKDRNCTSNISDSSDLQVIGLTLEAGTENNVISNLKESEIKEVEGSSQKFKSTDDSENINLIIETKRKRKKKIVYDPSDFYKPLIRKKKKKAATRIETVVEDEETMGEVDLLGGFTRRVMFPDNMNMCCECHRFMSDFTPDPMVSCSACSKEGHQSCASKTMLSENWFCAACRKKGKLNRI